MAEIAVVYRYAPGGNGKERPDFFSKELALASFLRSVERASVPVDVHFLVDGGAPRRVLTTMAAAGRVTVGSWGSNRRSYLEQLRVVVAGEVDAEFVWFSEDDYLYGEDAIDELAEAVRAMPAVDYFALTGPTLVERLECRRAQREVDVPGLPRSTRAYAAPGGRPWRAIPSTTSTFGARRAALLEDARILRAAPLSGAAWDRTTLLAVQGVRPYPWPSLLTDLVVGSSPAARHQRLRAGWKVAARIGMNVLSMRAPSRRRVVAAPPEELIAHLELPFEAREEDWLEAGRKADVVCRDEFRGLFGWTTAVS